MESLEGSDGAGCDEAGESAGEALRQAGGVLVVAALAWHRSRVPAQRGVRRLARTVASWWRCSGEEAHRLARVVVGLERWPGLEEALVQGRVGVAHGVLIVAADERLVPRSGELVAAAERMTPAELAQHLAELERALDVADPARRAARQRERTGASSRTGVDGMTTITLHLPAPEAAVVMTAAERIVEELWRQEHPSGHGEDVPRWSYTQRLADAFVEMARRSLEHGGWVGSHGAAAAPFGGAGSGSREPADTDDGEPGRAQDDSGATAGHGRRRGRGREPVAEVVVLVDYAVLLSDLALAEPGAVCRLDDGTPISAATARRLACDARVLPAVLGGESEVLDEGRAKRTATAAQRRALMIRDGPTCVVPGCTVSWRRTRAHHLRGFGSELRGRTNLAEMALLCNDHHHDVHEGEHRLLWHDGHWHLYAPGDEVPPHGSLFAHQTPISLAA